MNARDELYAFATVAFKETGVPPIVHETVTTLINKAIAERDAQIIEWLEKKAHEEGTSNKERRARAGVLYRMADKLSRGAVRPPLSKGPDPEEAVRKALEPVERLALAFENTGEPEIGRQIRSAIKAGAATQ